MDDDKSKAENKAKLTYSLRLVSDNIDEIADGDPQSVRHMLFTPIQRENRISKSRIVLGLVMSTY